MLEFITGGQWNLREKQQLEDSQQHQINKVLRYRSTEQSCPLSVILNQIIDISFSHKIHHTNTESIPSLLSMLNGKR